jgi:hypothetical protein
VDTITREQLDVKMDRSEMVHIEEDPNLDFINSMAKKYLGLDKYPYHQPGVERVVVRPEHTIRMGA